MVHYFLTCQWYFFFRLLRFAYFSKIRHKLVNKYQNKKLINDAGHNNLVGT